VQSTADTPQGQLTLRVYPGDECSGELYQDDGKSYAFEHGAYLRMKFSCEKTADGVRFNIGPHEGSYPAWWKEMRLEMFGVSPHDGEVLVNGKAISPNIDVEHQMISFALEDEGKGALVEVR
jgi:alpha-glucosidase